MKKLLGIIVSVIFTEGWLMAASVTVTKPALHGAWNREQTYAIIWTRKETMPDNVRITLRDKNSAPRAKRGKTRFGLFLRTRQQFPWTDRPPFGVGHEPRAARLAQVHLKAVVVERDLGEFAKDPGRAG
jgi:hypothetical protein